MRTVSIGNNLCGIFPHLTGGSVFSSDFDYPVSCEFNIVEFTGELLQLQVYPTSANTREITPFIQNGSHVKMEIYQNNWKITVDDNTPITINHNLTDKCRIGIQILNATIKTKDIVIYPL